MEGYLSEARIDADVLIVGGGMIGLTLANALAGARLSVVLIDRAKPADQLEAGFDGRVSAVAAGSARMLRALGAWQPVEEHAQPILDIRVSDGDSRLFLHYDHRTVGEEPLGYIVENRRLRRALHDQAAIAGIEHWAPVSLSEVDYGPAFARAALEDGRTIRSRLVIGADGRNSFIRSQAGIPVTRRAYPQAGIVCTVAHERPHGGVAQERFLPAGPFAILPMKGNRSSLVWTERSDLAADLMLIGDEEFAAELMRRFTDYLGDVALVGARWCYPLELSWSPRMIDRRLALVGDAAHSIHPIAGQGLNLGLRDAAALAEILVDAHRLGLDIAAAAVLARYQRWRRLDVVTMSTVTDALNNLFASDLVPLRFARGVGLAAVDRLPALKRFFMRHAMGLVGDLPRLSRGEPL